MASCFNSILNNMPCSINVFTNSTQITVYLYRVTHRLSCSYHSHQLHNIGVSKLSINGSLLEEPYLLCLCHSWLQLFHSHLHSSCGALPHPHAYYTKLTRAKGLGGPVSIDCMCSIFTWWRVVLGFQSQYIGMIRACIAAALIYYSLRVAIHVYEN